MTKCDHDNAYRYRYKPILPLRLYFVHLILSRPPLMATGSLNLVVIAATSPEQELQGHDNLKNFTAGSKAVVDAFRVQMVSFVFDS